MAKKRAKLDRFGRAAKIFRKHGGILRASRAVREGVHPDTLYTMRDTGTLERISRGLYRLADAPPLSNPDLTLIARRIPNGVVCLISALSFHDITTQIPHEIYVALEPGSEEPRIDHPPIRTFRFSGKAFTEGIEIHEIDGSHLRVYSLEKTLADCFKFRNKIGLDTAIESLRLYRERREINVDNILRFASVCRVTKTMRPYLEALL